MRLITPLFKAKCLGEIMGHRAKKSPDKQWVNFFEVNQTRNTHESMLTCVDINCFQSSVGLAEKAEVMEYDAPRSWRITIPTQDNDIFEEVVLHLQGIVCGKDLPPIL